MKVVGIVSIILLIVGGLNRGLYGIWGFDLVAYLLGDMTTLARIVYVLVWLAAVSELVNLVMKKD